MSRRSAIFGTPVVLISITNDDGSYNLAPMSSAFWLGRRCVLGLTVRSKTPQNARHTGECALNLPSDGLVAAVDRLARTTGVAQLLIASARACASVSFGGTIHEAPITPHPLVALTADVQRYRAKGY